MTALVYQGAEANLRALAGEISTHEDLDGIRVQIFSIDTVGSDSLQYGPIAEIVISIASGIATSTIYDTIRLLVDRARDRGKIVEKPDEQNR